MPELEAQKKAAAAVRDFKEAARLSAEAKVGSFMFDCACSPSIDWRVLHMFMAASCLLAGWLGGLAWGFAWNLLGLALEDSLGCVNKASVGSLPRCW